MVENDYFYWEGVGQMFDYCCYYCQQVFVKDQQEGVFKGLVCFYVLIIVMGMLLQRVFSVVGGVGILMLVVYFGYFGRRVYVLFYWYFGVIVVG